MAEVIEIDLVQSFGTVFKYPKSIISAILYGNSYIIDGKYSDKFDLQIYQDVDFEFDNIIEGIEYTIILRTDPANSAMVRPVSLYFMSAEGYHLNWKNVINCVPTFNYTAKITLIRLGDNIYADFLAEYEDCGTGSDGYESI